MADAASTRSVRVGQIEFVHCSGRAFNEELDRRKLESFGCVNLRRERRDLQRRKSAEPFSFHPQWFAASRKYAYSASFPQETRYKIGRSSDDMLAVVEYKQHLPVSQRGDQAGKRIVATNCQPQGGRQCCKYKARG